MSTKKTAEGHRPAKKNPEIEQAILDSKAALATSPDKVEQQQAYPNALASDTAQESVDNQTGLQEQQPASPPEVVPPTNEEIQAEGTPDDSPAAQQIQDEVKASTDLASAEKKDLVGEPATILATDEEKVRGAKTVDLGKAGKLKIESLGRQQHGIYGAEYDVTVKVADDRTVTLHGIPADLLKQ